MQTFVVLLPLSHPTAQDGFRLAICLSIPVLLSLWLADLGHLPADVATLWPREADADGGQQAEQEIGRTSTREA
jgi:hypothetical protein